MPYKYTAVIIEPRKHKALEFVLCNALENLSEEWQVILFHGTKNRDYVKGIMERFVSLGVENLKLVELDVENLNQVTYSELLASKEIIYDHIETDYMLVFQTDSMIFTEHKDLIYQFIEMDIDYVGAPWLVCGYPPTRERDFIGNGGMSLRKVKTMRKIMLRYQWNPNGEWHEDLFFTKPYPGIECKKPPYEMAKQFCVDEVFSPISFGCHRPWCHSHFKELVKLQPELQKLYELQGEE